MFCSVPDIAVTNKLNSVGCAINGEIQKMKKFSEVDTG